MAGTGYDNPNDGSQVGKFGASFGKKPGFSREKEINLPGFFGDFFKFILRVFGSFFSCQHLLKLVLSRISVD